MVSWPSRWPSGRTRSACAWRLAPHRSRCCRLVIAQAFRLVFVGVAAGLLAAIALTRVLSALLFDTDARDPWTLAGTALVLMLVALAAASLPARRGTRIMPIQALRVQ